jgi:hypothetical protein
LKDIISLGSPPAILCPQTITVPSDLNAAKAAEVLAIVLIVSVEGKAASSIVPMSLVS